MAAVITSSVDISFVFKNFFLLVFMNLNAKKKCFCRSWEHILYSEAQLPCESAAMQPGIKTARDMNFLQYSLTGRLRL